MKLISKIFAFLIVFMFVGTSYFYYDNYVKENGIVKVSDNKSIKSNSAISMLYETDAGSGEYAESKDNSWPSDGYTFNSTLSKCENGSSITWDNTNNKVLVSATTSDKCYVYFDIRRQYLSDAVMSLASVSGGNVYNEGDAGYRYEGKEVDNYITFNDETWRIIGVEEGSKIGLTSGKYYTKIIREYNDFADSALFSLPYDSDGDHGIDWSTTSLYTLLNGDYYNRSGDYASVGLTAESKVLMVDANWYYTPIGSVSYWESNHTTFNWYTNERSDTTKVVKDSVGIMYPSDYGYAAIQSECSAVNPYEYQSFCYQKDWLYYESDYWTITPYSDSGSGHYLAFAVNFAGNLEDSYNIDEASIICPVLYLDSDVVITNDGDGSIGNEFEVGK